VGTELNKRLFLLNGLFILGVVLNHAAGWGTVAMFCWAHRFLPAGMAASSQVGSLAYYILIIVRQITALSVAGFLFTAGCFLVYAGRGSQQTLSWKFIRTRILNLLIPYFIWSVIIFVQIYITEGVTHTPLEYLGLFLSTGADGPYYFVPLMCYLYLLAPFLMRLAKERPVILLMLAGLLQVGTSLFRYAYLAFGSTPAIDFLLKISPDWSVPRWILFFSAGLVVGTHLETFKAWLKRAKPWLGWAVLVAGLAAMVEPELVYRLGGLEWRSVPFPLTHQVYSLLAVFLLMTWEVEKTWLFKPLYYLGSRSYGIYLTHHKVMEIIGRVIYHLAPGFLAYQVPLSLIYLGGGLGLSLGLMKVVIMTPLRRYYRYLFG